LPDEFRNSVVDKLKKFINEYNKTHDTDIGPIFTQIFHELDQPFNLEAAKKFLAITEQVDNLRKENLFEVIPEMLVVKEYVEKLG
jgi:hypothetical protein